jgi:hypothetical protein
VFLSYSRGDRALALRILQSLRALNVDVWWDEDMPGVDWQDYLASKINELAAVLVIWTPLSIASKNVKDEARLGQSTDKLVNVIVGAPAPPFPFDRVNGLPLDGWTGRKTHNGWTRVIRTIEERLVAVGGSNPGELTAALRHREQSIEDCRRQVTDAEAACAEAQAADADARAAQESARSEVAAAEAQLRSVMEMHGGAALLRAAQQELDAALAARTDAEEARRTAATSRAAASRSLSSAKVELERLFGEADHAPEPGDASFPPVSSRPARPAPEPDQPAPSAALASRISALARPFRLPLAAALGAVIAVVVVGTLALRSGAGHTPAAAVTEGSTGPSVGLARAAAPPPDPAATLVGRWGVAGLGCASPVAFSVAPDGLTRTFAGSTVSVRPAANSAQGVQVFRAADGTSYEVHGDVVSMTPTGASRPINMTRCDG